MLSIREQGPKRDRGVSRRELLSVGTLGLGGLTLPMLMAGRARAGSESNALSGKSVIFLFQQGGPSQFETFDPKPDAPEGIRTVNGTIQTSLPGVHFGGTLSRLARHADKLTVVRSYQTNNGGHNIRPFVGPDSLETNIGVHYARVAGTTRIDSGLPTNMVLFPQAVSNKVTKGRARGNLSATGEYGDTYAPFVPGAGGKLQENMTVRLDRNRLFSDRRQLLSQLDRINNRLDASGQFDTIDSLTSQAFQLLLGGGVANALDLTREDPKVLAHYDTSPLVRSHNWDKVNRGKRGFYTGHASTLGRLLLLSRRLCEAGCGFVTVHASYDGVWDMHADKNNLNMVEGMEAVGTTFDHAVAAFIEDIESRGLQNDILLICSGEMGRTPRINKRGGRDHWSRLAPLLVYGGGTRGGRVIGQSTRNGGQPVSDNLTPRHLIASILHTVFDAGKLRLLPGVPPQISRLADHATIPGLD
ncbi:MAG: hypothetical protein CMJ65_09865 [Planctomycetaceae bacterium]|jgi:hypothetical protein|nr:hypothetical protein [Planctomycetaceae bacterium]MDP7275908.1 DUF1501 domain-containing protein [Planctomycetaceae bacterium]